MSPAPSIGYSQTTTAGSCSSRALQSSVRGPTEGTARLHLHPEPALGTPTPIRAKGQWSHQECDSRRGLFLAGHSAPLSLSPPATPGRWRGWGWRRASAATAPRVTPISPNTARSEGRRSPGTERIPQPPLISSRRLIGTFVPGWGLCQGGNLSAAGSRGLPCPRLGTERGQAVGGHPHPSSLGCSHAGATSASPQSGG